MKVDRYSSKIAFLTVDYFSISDCAKSDKISNFVHVLAVPEQAKVVCNSWMSLEQKNWFFEVKSMEIFAKFHIFINFLKFVFKKFTHL